MASDKPISFRVTNELRDEIAKRVPRSYEEADARHSFHVSARLAVSRYYDVVRHHDPRRWLSRAELAIVCDVRNGTLLDLEHDELHVRAIWHEVADAIDIARRSLPDPTTGQPQILVRHCREGEPPVDGDSLVRKLQSAPYADLVALADFCERFWADDPGANAVIYPEAEGSK